jgi:type I restriction enzyme, R subunit
VVRGADGKEYKPDDYLNAFSEFVKNNPKQLEAIEILLSRPKDWSTDALVELQQKLVAAPQRFTSEHLPEGPSASLRRRPCSPDLDGQAGG